MMLMGFVGGKSRQQLVMANKLAQDLKGSFRVQIIDNGSLDFTTDGKVARLSRAILARQFRDRVIVVTGVNTQAEFDLLRRYNAVICISSAPLHTLFNVNEILPTDLFVCSRPGRLDTAEKRQQYITPEEAFSICYGRERGFKEAV